MKRSREQIMAEWDIIRDFLAGGGAHSGPRDWFENVLDEAEGRIVDAHNLAGRLMIEAAADQRTVEAVCVALDKVRAALCS